MIERAAFDAIDNTKEEKAEQSVMVDPDTGKWKGIKLFEIAF